MAHHLVILKPPYLRAVLSGRKQVEARFSKIGCPPYGRVHAGDTLWLKKSGGNVVAFARAARVFEYPQLDVDRVESLQREFSRQVAADDLFWASVRQARYATLIRLSHVQQVRPFAVVNRGRRGWYLLSEPPKPGQRIVPWHEAVGR